MSYRHVLTASAACAALLLSFNLWSEEAHANWDFGESHTYPGSTCHATYGGTEVRYWEGMFGNDSGSSDMQATCPAISASGDSYSDRINAGVQVDDQSTTEAVVCRVYACVSNFSSCYVTSTQTTSTSGTGKSYMNLATSWYVASRELVSVRCDIPNRQAGRAASRVHSYSMDYD